MACFIVPAVEAVIVTVIAQALKSKENGAAELRLKAESEQIDRNVETKFPFSRKLKWLSNLLWGGAALLAFEHVWHGEVVPWFPFLTAASNPADAMAMLHEMSTVGVTMAVLVTAVWAVMLLVSRAAEKKPLAAQTAAN